MIFHMVALSLPVEGYYLPLHKHESAHLCKWTAQDREDFTRIVSQIEALYEAGPGKAVVNREDLEALYDETLTPQEASRRVLPYYITCSSSNKKRIRFPHRTRNDVTIVGPAATPEEGNGLRLAVIGKGCAKLSLLPWVLDEVSRLSGTLYTEEIAQTLEGRSDRNLVDVVANSRQPVTAEGFAKIVAVPAEVQVRLSRTHRGEFISEIPRVWA